MNRRIGWMMCLILVLILSGCQKNEPVQQGVQAEEKPVESVADSTQEEPEAEPEAEAEIATPYQYLALMAGNAMHLSFDFKTVYNETGLETTGNFARTEEYSSVNYTDWDMNGESVAIVEIERDGRHYFVLHEKKAIIGYVGPSTHAIYYEMLAAVQNEPVREEVVEGGKTFEYHMPFVHDESIKLRYIFKMTAEGLESLEYYVDEVLARTVTFGAFKTDDLPESFYELPQNYEITEYEYRFDEANMPPWWDYDSDQ